MKLNNKGYLIVEIIVASVIAMGLAYFLLELVIDLKNKNEDYYVNTVLETDKVLMTREVMNDISNYKIKSVTSNNVDYVDFVFDVAGEEVTKRITISEEDKKYIFRYGKYLKEENKYNMSDIDYYEKVFANELTISDDAVNINNYCYYSTGYVNCNDLTDESMKTVIDGLIIINIDAKTLYSDYNYGVIIYIPYKVNEVTINVYVPVPPRINSKSSNFVINQGENYEIIDEYFDYDTNGGTNIIEKKCVVNDDEITETKDLSSGTYDITCSVKNEDNLTATASTTLTVNEINQFVYISSRKSSNSGSTTIVYKNNEYLTNFSNGGQVSAIGCTKDTCYISSRASGYADSSTTMYKNNANIAKFANEGVVSAIGCTKDTCYISTERMGYADSSTTIYKNDTYVTKFYNSGIVSAIGANKY